MRNRCAEELRVVRRWWLFSLALLVGCPCQDQPVAIASTPPPTHISESSDPENATHSSATHSSATHSSAAHSSVVEPAAEKAPQPESEDEKPRGERCHCYLWQHVKGCHIGGKTCRPTLGECEALARKDRVYGDVVECHESTDDCKSNRFYWHPHGTPQAPVDAEGCEMHPIQGAPP